MTSAALLTHLAGSVLTVATLVTVTRRDGAVYAFTDHDESIVFSGRAYLAGTYTPSAIVSSADLAVDNLEMTGIIDGTLITREDLLAGTWRGARVVIEQVNYRDLGMGSRILRTGRLGEVSVGETAFKAELRGLAQLLQQTVGEITSIQCRADLGDARCGVNVEALAVTGAVQSVHADNRTLFDAARTEPGPAGAVTVTGITTAQYAQVTAPGHGCAVGQVVMLSDVAGMTAIERVEGQTYTGATSINGRHATVRSVTSAALLVLNLDTRNYRPYASGGQLNQPGAAGTFTAGKLVWTSGDNTGRAMEVRSYVPGCILLAQPMPRRSAPGDAYKLYPGCGKRALEDCRNRYNNILNFRGEPHLPGVAKLMEVGGS